MSNKVLSVLFFVAAIVITTIGLSTSNTTPVVANNANLVTSIHPIMNPISETETLVKNIQPIKLSNRVVYLTSEVTPDSASHVVSELKKLNSGSEPVYLLIDSPGGSVFDGTAIISQMESMTVPVNTVCLSLCASMAAVIHQYGSNRYAVDRSVLMFHPASGGARGQVKNMLSVITMIDRFIEKMDNHIISRSGMDKHEYERLVAYELWLDAEDALKKKLVDGIVSLNGEINIKTFPSSQEKHNNRQTLDSFVN